MFKVGERVLQKKTGNVGQVIGYGYQLTDNVYQTTVQVLSLSPTGKRVIVEDTLLEWIPSER